MEFNVIKIIINVFILELRYDIIYFRIFNFILEYYRICL